MLQKLFAVLAVAGLAAPVSASTIATLNVLTDTTYNVTLSASLGDNFGIASYAVNVAGVSTMVHNSPRVTVAEGSGGEGSAGFFALRAQTNPVPGQFNLTASQELVPAPTPNLVYGYGQEASSFAAKGIVPVTTAIQPVWDVPLMIAQGTWEDTGEALPLLLLASVGTFNSGTGTLTTTTPSEMRVIDHREPVIPEPSTIALAGLALVGLVGYARRKK